MLGHGELLNLRWTIFNEHEAEKADEDDNKPPDNEIDLTQLREEIERFRPQQNFWTMISNFLSSKDVWTQTPLNELNIDLIMEEMKRFSEMIMMSGLEFLDNKSDVEVLKKEIERIEKCFEVVKDLKNPELNEVHLRKLNLSLTLNIDELMMRGTSSALREKIRQTLIEAKLEATREREEKFRKEIAEKEKQRRDEELLKQKQMRRAKRPDLFN